MRPESGLFNPASNVSSVDLPLAFGPRIATISRCFASKLAGPNVNFGADLSVAAYA
jgi:hypothetical protein